MRPLLFFLLSSLPVLAQPFSAGIKAGVPITDSLTAPQNGILEYNAPTQRYIIGGMAEVRLPFGFGVEFDALYRSLQYSSSPNEVTINASGNNWEFPLVLKYRFHFPIAKPYVEAGVAWDDITSLKETVNQIATTPSDLQKNTTNGFVIGGGVDIHAIFLHISPEIRYTRWSSQQISVVQSTFDVLHSNQNQAEFLVGITF